MVMEPKRRSNPQKEGRRQLVLCGEPGKTRPAHGVVFIRVPQAGALELAGHECRRTLVAGQVALQPRGAPRSVACSCVRIGSLSIGSLIPCPLPGWSVAHPLAGYPVSEQGLLTAMLSDVSPSGPLPPQRHY